MNKTLVKPSIMSTLGTRKSNPASKNPFASDEAIKFLNYRIEMEEASSRIYESMSLWLDNEGYLGAAKAFKKDAEDERTHAQWAKQYLLDMGIQPTLSALPKPEQNFTGLEQIFQKSYDHELLITEECNEMASKAMKSGDHLLYHLASKYMGEQQEELGKVITRLDRLSIIGTEKTGLLIIDQELGEGEL